MDPFLAEIKLFAGNFAPRGWAFCNGQLLPISANSALYALLGTTYGGDGRTNFALPDLRSRVPVQQGTGVGLSTYNLGGRGGSEQVVLTEAEMPAHTHTLRANNGNGTSADPTNRVLANTVGFDREYTDTANIDMSSQAVSNTGGSRPFGIRQPYLALNFIIAIEGTFPSRS